MKHHHISLSHALDGLKTGFKTQPNFKVHLILSFLAITAGLILKITATEWLILTFTIAVGLAIELLNTAIEFTVDLLTQEYKLLAKFAKDTAAAAMLLYSLGAIALAMQIFLPRFVQIWQSI